MTVTCWLFDTGANCASASAIRILIKCIEFDTTLTNECGRLVIEDSLKERLEKFSCAQSVAKTQRDTRMRRLV